MTSTSADAPFDVLLRYHSCDGEWVALLKDRQFTLPPLPARRN